MTNSPLSQQVAAQILQQRRRARNDIICYAQAIDVPGRPVNDDTEENEFFRPVESGLAAHHVLFLRKLEEISHTPHGRLMLLCPPGSAKSTYASVVFPSRFLGKVPDRRLILASYGQTLARKMGRRTRAIIKQKRYTAIWRCGLSSDSAAADEFSLTNGSEYIACGFNAGITGNRAHGIIIDDPIKGRLEAESQIVRDHVYEVYQDDLLSRLIPGGFVVLIMCMVGDTKVLMADGSEHNLRDIRPGDEIATYKDGVLGKSFVERWKSQGEDSVYEIKTLSGATTRANLRHPFLIERGGVCSWVRLQNLRAGDAVLRVSATAAPTPSMEVGAGLFARRPDAISPWSARDFAKRTIRNKGGRKGYAHRRIIQNREESPDCAIGTRSSLLNIKHYLLRKAGSALSAANLLRRMFACIGAANYVSITIMKPERCEDSFATTAISQSATEKTNLFCGPRPNISDFTPDPIVSIKPCGRDEVFDIQVLKTGNFIADGFVSHNTRWNEDDPAGRILPETWKGESGKIACRDGNIWDIICLQARCEVLDDPLGRKRGEYLWAEWFDKKHWDQFEANKRTWTSLYQQLPRPLEGSLFNLETLLVNGKPVPLPTNCDYVYAVIDTAAKTGKHNDGTAVTFFARNEFSDIPLLIIDWNIVQIEGDLLLQWLPKIFSQLEELGKRVGARRGSIGAFIEDASTGTILLQHAWRNDMPAHSIEHETAGMGKVERAMAATPYTNRGDVKFTEAAYNKTVSYKGATRNHLLSQVLGFNLSSKNDGEDDALDTFSYGVVIGLEM